MKRPVLAAAVALLAAAAPAMAQRGGAASGFVTIGPRAGGAPAYAPGNFPIPGLPPVAGGIDGRIFGGHGRIDGPDRPNRPDRPDRPDRPRKRDRSPYGYGIVYGGSIDPDLGYFASRGSSRRIVNGRVEYDYDRGYPYDHYSYSREAEAPRHTRREAWCETEWTRDHSGGGRVPVRVCRN